VYEVIRGQEVAVARLKAACRSGRIAHAYLFTGPAGVGKYAAARGFAAALLCASAREGVACGKCFSCRLFQSGNHPDYHVLAPEGVTIGIEKIRRITFALGQRPHHRRHVVVIDQAEKVTAEGQNAFLKTLEDPPGGAVLILVTAHPNLLLPTVVSRCCEVRFRRLHPGVVVEELVQRHGVPPDEAKILAVLSGGSIGRALELRRPEMMALREKVLRCALAPALREVQGSAVYNKTEVEEWLAFFNLWYRDLLLYRITGDSGPVVNTDRLAELKEARLSRTGLVASLEAVEAARRMLRANVNPRLVLEGLVVRLGSIMRSQKPEVRSRN
jgi:DNA polymerase-3 subunit delta'